MWRDWTTEDADNQRNTGLRNRRGGAYFHSMGMKPRVQTAPQLPTNATPQLFTKAVFGASEAQGLALGGNRELEGLALCDPDELLWFGCNDVFDAWTSTNGTSYVGAWNEYPLLQCTSGRWVSVALPRNLNGECNRIVRVVGFSGPTPDADELYCLAVPYAARAHQHGSLLWRRGGAWRQLELPPGEPLELAVARQGEVYVSIAGNDPTIIRARGDQLKVIPSPPTAHGQRACGLCGLPDGRLLACFAPKGSDDATPWMHDGEWHPLAGPALLGWATGYVDTVFWGETVHLASTTGIFALAADDAIERLSQLSVRRLWTVGDALIACGSDHGTFAHAINRGDGWQPYSLPAPAVVRGGFGKLAWLPPQRKVPRRRVRLTAPTAAAPATTNAPLEIDGYSQRWLEARAFCGRGREQMTPWFRAADLRAHTGSDLSLALASYVDLCGAWEPPAQFGELTMVRPGDRLPTPSPSPAELADFTFFAVAPLVAALTDTFLMGTDRAGQLYLAETAAHRSQVFLYDPGQGALAFLADSVDAFLYLNDVAQQWREFARAHDVDFLDVEAGAIDTARPEIVDITRGFAKLSGRVDLSEDADVTSDFHQLLPALTSVRPTAKSSSNVTAELFDRAEWLIMHLAGIYTDVSTARTLDFDADNRDPALASLAASKIYWLWHLFLFSDPRLSDLLKATRTHVSGLVRGTAAMIEAATGTNPPAELSRLGQLREQVRVAAAL